MLQGDLHIVFDDEIKIILDKIFSCLSNKPEDVDKSEMIIILDVLSKIIYLEETDGIYYLIYKILLRKLQTAYYINSYVPELDRESIDTALQTSIDSIIEDSQFNYMEFCEEMGVKLNKDIESDRKELVDLVYNETLAYFDSIKELGHKFSEVMDYVNTLQECVLENVSLQLLQMSAKILQGDGVRFGYKFYKGREDYETFMKFAPSYIRNRDNVQKSDALYSFETVEDNLKLEQERSKGFREIFKVGFPPLDEVFGIRASDIVTLIGDEGVGKTNMMVHMVYQCLMSGKDALVMSGESLPMKIRYMVISKYIYEKTRRKISWVEIAERDNLSEQMQVIIRDCERDFTEREDIGRLFIIKEFTYEDFFNEVEGIIQSRPERDFGLVAIDHIDALKGTGMPVNGQYFRTERERVNLLYSYAVDLSDKYPLAVLMVAHTSSATAQAGARGKSTGVRIGATSSATSKDADLLFYIYTTEELRKEGLIRFDVRKVRDHRDDILPFILEKQLSYCTFVYSDELQLKLKETSEEDIEDLF